MIPQTRKRILDYLHRHKTATTAELSNSLGMTRANIQHHIQILRHEGTIESISSPPSANMKTARGRPTLFHSLSFNAFPDNLPHLSKTLIGEYLKTTPGKDSRSFKPLIESMFPMESHHFSSSLTQRLSYAVYRLNQHSYNARWEAHHQGPQISISVCPYSRILLDCPELCLLDASIIEHLISNPVKQTAKMDLQHFSCPSCIFTTA